MAVRGDAYGFANVGPAAAGIFLLSGVIAGNLAAAIVSSWFDEVPFQPLVGICAGLGLIVGLVAVSSGGQLAALAPLAGVAILGAGLLRRTELDNGSPPNLGDSLMAGLLGALLAVAVASLWALLLTRSWRPSALTLLPTWTGWWAAALVGVALVFVGGSSVPSVGLAGWLAAGAAVAATVGAVVASVKEDRGARTGWLVASVVYGAGGVILLAIV